MCNWSKDLDNVLMIFIVSAARIEEVVVDSHATLAQIYA